MRLRRTVISGAVLAVTLSGCAASTPAAEPAPSASPTASPPKSMTTRVFLLGYTQSDIDAFDLPANDVRNDPSIEVSPGDGCRGIGRSSQWVESGLSIVLNELSGAPVSRAVLGEGYLASGAPDGMTVCAFPAEFTNVPERSGYWVEIPSAPSGFEQGADLAEDVTLNTSYLMVVVNPALPATIKTVGKDEVPSS